ncbi:MAG: mannitol dehydrogenase family protein [Hyphomonadaceae bacterium]|nr:mannitol dehydrogenase family protein [Hyphomonadaceae bacterium]
MTTLSLKSLASITARPSYDPAAVAIGVVHFGPGAFHRAHQLDYLDRLLARDPRWGVSGVSLKSVRVRDALKPQDGLFALSILDEEPAVRVIGALREVLYGREDGAVLKARLAAAQTEVVTLTVTEAGYCLAADGGLDLAHRDVAADIASPETPSSALGWIVAGLRARRAAGLRPYTIISCDNLSGNGAKLKAALVSLARETDVDLASWLEDTLECPNTMVDSITPATDDSVRRTVEAALGVRDAEPVQREAFTDWVIEAHAGGGPDWAAAGALVAPDVAPFADAKLRLLNGAHSSLAYVGLAAGCETVAQAMRAPWLADFARGIMADARATLHPTPGRDLADYSEAILKRFHNPAIRHELKQIAMDGSQKLPIRVLSVIADRLRGGATIARHALTMAAWMRFVVRSTRSGTKIADPLASALAELAAGMIDAEADVARFLSFRAVFPEALAAAPPFRDAVSQAYTAMIEAERSTDPAAALARMIHAQA